MTGITKTMVGLSNVDNTTDANKPISTATQSALALKAPLDAPAFTGNISFKNGRYGFNGDPDSYNIHTFYTSPNNNGNFFF